MKQKLKNAFRRIILPMLMLAAITAAYTPKAAGMTDKSAINYSELNNSVSSGGAAAVTAMGGVPSSLVPVGKTAGIKLFSDGVMVVGLSVVKTDGGEASPSMEAGLRIGDIICTVDGETVSDARRLAELTTQSQGSQMSFVVCRENERSTVQLSPVKEIGGGSYKIGAWVRDSMAGIGTITFYDPASGVFGALGHGICDSDTGRLMPMLRGGLMEASVTGVRKGIGGEPGELRGSFDSTEDFAKLFSNSETGIYGKVSQGKDAYFSGMDPIPVAGKDEVHKGEARILSNIDGKAVKSYSVEITKIPSDSEQSVKNMMIRVTDDELLEKTGGIVQGMSGSPIIQDGRFVGAVTHVLINDPTRGYAIFIGNMLDTASRAAA